MSLLPLLARRLLGLGHKRLPSRLPQRNISYVERIRFLQQLKEQDAVCLSHLPEGQFLVFSRSKPLVQVNQGNTTQALVWLSYADVMKYHQLAPRSTVLLDVSEEGKPRYSVQVGALATETQEQLERDTGASFTDLRLALFMVTWQDAHMLSRANCVHMWNKNTAFCGKCGAPTERNAAGYSRVCSSCGHTQYPSSAPVGIVLVTDPDHTQVVLVRQPRHPPGMYSCIAGFSDAGESLEETVKREVAEEVGMEVASVRYVASQHWPFPGSLMAGCFAMAHIQDLKIDEKELQDARWFSRQEVSEALERIKTNPHLRLRGNPSGELFVPPPGAIAFHLISHWIKRTPVHQIYHHIY